MASGAAAAIAQAVTRQGASEAAVAALARTLRAERPAADAALEAGAAWALWRYLAGGGADPAEGGEESGSHEHGLPAAGLALLGLAQTYGAETAWGTARAGRADSGPGEGTEGAGAGPGEQLEQEVAEPDSSVKLTGLVRLLSDLARRSPNWEVLIKPRIAPGDATFHDVDTHISTTLKQSLGVPPANLRLDYRPLPELLKQARLLATLSSTAFFDALDFGCRAIAISDLGLQPDYGGHVYAGSGVWRSLEAIPNLDALDAEGPSPDPRWLEWMGYGQPFSPSALLEVLNEQKGQTPATITSSVGYPGNAQSSFNQLRLGAEAAIATGDWTSAQELLCQASLMRPMHRGVARRFWAVRQSNPLLRRIALLISYRDLK